MNNRDTRKGAFYILISAIFYGSYGIWSRLMAEQFGEFSQAWTRGLLLLFVVIVLNMFMKFWKPIHKSDWKWFVIIALAGGLNQAPYFYGFEHLTIGTATLLFYAALVVGGYVLGKIIFKEKISSVKLASLIIAFIGMISLYGFSLRADQFLPATLTVLAGIMGSSTVILPKKLVGNYHELQIMAGYFIMQVACNLPLALVFNDALPAIGPQQAWFAQLGYAAAMMIANMAAITGFSYLEASIGSLIGLAEILFGVLLGVIFFAEHITTEVFIGGGLILLAASLPSIVEVFHRNVDRSSL